MLVENDLRMRKPFPKNMNQIHTTYGVSYPTVYYYAHTKLGMDKENNGLISKENEKELLKIFRRRRGKFGRIPNKR